MVLAEINFVSTEMNSCGDFFYTNLNSYKNQLIFVEICVFVGIHYSKSLLLSNTQLNTNIYFKYIIIFK